MDGDRDRAIKENQALRAASEAIKMMALSQKVECPVNIKEYFTTPQCPSVNEEILKKMPLASAEEQFKRSLLFFRYLQQGVKPSICERQLPPEEEAQFISDWKRVMATHDTKKYLTKFLQFCDKFLNIPTNERIHAEINEVFVRFLKGGDNKTLPLTAFNCTKKGPENNSDFGRFNETLFMSEEDRQIQFEEFDFKQERLAQGKNTLPSVAVETTSTDITDLSILIYDYSKPDVKSFGDDINQHSAKDLMYISANKSIINYSNEYDIITIIGKTIFKQKLIRELFTQNAVVDVHPWLMYLLQTTPATHESFMSRAFGGSMSPLKKHNLAFYIIAHYVANNDPAYKENPSSFYRLDYSVKFIKMKDAISAAKPLIDKGYAWLKENRPTDRELKTMFNNRPEFNGRNFRGLIKGGKRVTRRFRK